MRKWTAMAIASGLALAGCKDAPPWDGIFGLKSGITIGDAKELMDATRIPGSEISDSYKWPNAQVYGANKAPGYAPSDWAPDDYPDEHSVDYVFNSEEVLCAVSIVEYFEDGDTPPVKKHLVTQYGAATQLGDDEYTYPQAEHDLGDGVKSVTMSVFEPSPMVPGWINVVVQYLPDSECT
ncbi:hypothetical protein RSO41_05885 [Halomonas sp. I1]|uniref:hypothetical protein n=1 Tax=Halomonas sp. I1 TaxID=393536 RepID=UPI0028DF2111|nr:hypothetical protein [Halomonas sp. I1]MDT8894179.1 hypothetical protein [Halomonas sp. I1]